MDRVDHKWKSSQNHEKKVYSKRVDYSSKKRAEEIFDYFGKNFQDIKQARILSIGAGMGIIHSLDFECDNIAIDPLIKYNRNKLEESSATLITGIGECLPFRDNSMDIVYTYNVLDHCIAPDEVLEEIGRVNKINGELLLEVNTYEVPEVIRNAVVARLDREHPHHFSSDEIRSLITHTGYEINEEKLLNRFELLKNPTIRRIGAIPFRMRRYFVTAKNAKNIQ